MSVTKFIKVRLPEIGDIYTKYNAIEFGTTVYWFRKIQKRSVVLKNSILEKDWVLDVPMFHWKRRKQRDKSCF